MLLAAADTDAAESAAVDSAAAVDVGRDMCADGEGLGSLGVRVVEGGKGRRVGVQVVG